MDIFQQRYLGHIERKKKFQTTDKIFYSSKEVRFLIKVIKNRRSQRVFNQKLITEKEINLLLESIKHAPSSCNRQAIYIKIFDKIQDILVGGKDWMGEANKIFLIFADMKAYKSPNEIDFMPYLDAGVVVENIYLMAEILKIGVCFINPNIWDNNKEGFNDLYNREKNRFCGAIALGHYDRKAIVPPKRTIRKIIKF